MALASVGRVLTSRLGDAGFEVVPFADVAQAIASLRRMPIDCLVLQDAGEPTRHGLAALTLHAKLPGCIVVVGVAPDEGVDLLVAGATDYVDLRRADDELTLRIHARIAAALRGRPIGLSHARLDPRLRLLRLGDRHLHLTPREFALMQILLQHQGDVVGALVLIDHVWGATGAPGHRTLEQAVGRLRRRLLDAGLDRLNIRAVSGVGYRLDLEAGASGMSALPRA